MIERFDGEGLRQFLEAEPLAVVVAEPLDATGRHRAAKLTMTDAVMARFRTAAQRAVAELAAREPVPYDQGMMLEPGYVATATRVEIAGPFLGALEGAYGGPGTTHREPTADDLAVPERAGVYAIVANDGKGSRATLVRRRTPVKHPSRTWVAAVLVGSELDNVDDLFVFDGKIDVAVWNDQVLIRDLTVIESLFTDPAALVAERNAALDAIETAIPLANPLDVRAAAEADGRFARALRRAVATRTLERLSVDELRTAIQDWGLGGLRLEGDRLLVSLNGPERWEFPRLLFDAYLRSDRTNRRYESNSHAEWKRRRVTGTRILGGRITALIGEGDWSPRRVADVMADLEARPVRVRYYIVDPSGGVVSVAIRDAADRRELWADAAGSNALLALPAG